jgi:hypothetical protein
MLGMPAEAYNVAFQSFSTPNFAPLSETRILFLSWCEKLGISGWETYQRTFEKIASKNILQGKELFY